jgi:hypothetical protein
MDKITQAGFKILKFVFSKVKIIEDNKTLTASITKNNGSYYIKIGKSFKKNFIKTKNDEYFIYMHEYLHAFFSHLDLGKYYLKIENKNKEILNFAFDSIANYYIAKNLFLEEPQILKNFYKNLPYSLYILLNPYEVIRDGKLIKNLSSFLKKKKVVEYKKVSYWIKNFLYLHKEDVDKFIKFITYYLKKHFKKIYREIILIDSIKKKFIKGKRAEYSEEVEEQTIKIRDDEKFSEETITTFKIAIKKVLSHDISNLKDLKIEKVKSVIPFPGRKELLFLKLGYYPFFFPRFQRYVSYENKRPRIYIDVSASVCDYWNFVYEICIFLKDLIGEPVYIFSNRVFEISLEELEKGKIKTTYGTDFNCVAKHIIENNFKKALIITDGYAPISPSLLNELILKNVEIYMIVIDNYFTPDRTPLFKIAKKIWNVIFNKFPL